ncbi:DNA-binding protein [Pseudoduganella dura]|nr:DNA-binding protein [Pseudoduganella dura]GGY00660.1 integrase [Pseudoduganella dura]
MARAGLYKSDVKRARDALVAAGRHPSLDAVRIALGNTGSKTTIHKYLRELEAEEGTAGAGSSLSDELQALVTGLAERLRVEADARIVTLQEEHNAQLQARIATEDGLKAQLTASHGQVQALERRLATEQHALIGTREELQREQIARHTAEQHVRDLRDRLQENDDHIKSLENKHANARDALEHFRQASKEQREQDQRRHEHQVQQLQVESRQLQLQLVGKQEEVARLNQDGARLMSDLRHAGQALAQAQQTADRKEAEWSSRMADARQRATLKADELARQLGETRLELAGHGREIQLQQKELARIQRLHDQLLEEKVMWRHERAQMEEMLRQANEE